jgi:hypothetical protein
MFDKKNIDVFMASDSVLDETLEASGQVKITHTLGNDFKQQIDTIPSAFLFSLKKLEIPFDSVKLARALMRTQIAIILSIEIKIARIMRDEQDNLPKIATLRSQRKELKQKKQTIPLYDRVSG